MPPAPFSDAALVLLGHGSTLNNQSAAPVFQHGAELRKRNVFAEVREAFWKQEPQVKKILAELSNKRVFIVPLFISEGYFSEEVIPRELGFVRDAMHEAVLPRPSASPGFGVQSSKFKVQGSVREEETRRVLTLVQSRGSQTLFYCKPIGTHDSMTKVLLARAREVIKQFPFPRPPKPSETWLIIVGHGTEQNENSRKSIDHQVERIRAMSLYAGIDAVFLDEEPRVAKLYDLALSRNIVVVPFFISEGMHTQEDIPMLLGEPERIVRQRLKAGQPAWRNPTERKGKLVWYSHAVGTEPQIAEVILERVSESAGDDVRRL